MSVCKNLKARYDAGKKFSIVVIAEGAHDTDLGLPAIPENQRDECGHEKFVGLVTFWEENWNAGWVSRPG